MLPILNDLPLTYRLREAKASPRGLVVLMHGVGSNELSMLGLANLLPDDVTVALVRSPIEIGPSAYCTFEVRFTSNGPVIDAAAAETSRVRLLEFTTQLQAKLGVTPARTLAAGFSQGGIMAASMALTRPEVLAGFAILSGRILPEIEPRLAAPAALADLRGLILHGEQDDRLPLFWALRSAETLSALGVPFEAVHYPAAHQITEPMAHKFHDWVDSML